MNSGGAGRGSVGPPVRLTPEVREALEAGRPVVALESSVLGQGLPAPANAEAARRMVSAVTGRGAVPAITAVIDGQVVAGVTDAELARLLSGSAVRKLSSRDIGAAVAQGATGTTTVAGALAVIAHTRIQVFSTGGIGGVHHGPGLDESADLIALSRTPKVVVCSGAKAILDVPATVERLESLGVPVIGYRTPDFPAFFSESSGMRVGVTAESPDEIARIVTAHRALGRDEAVLVVQPPPAAFALARDEIERAVTEAIAQARREGVRGSAVTPFLLAAVERATGGRSLRTNLALLEANASLAADIAGCLTSRGPTGT